ncbi:hypothetical protein [Armatimonas sp.]|uniref:hypothetical protein n=1 Tax=Armatimonas sp. TaxID=1872638 RepID=UPI00375079E6
MVNVATVPLTEAESPVTETEPIEGELIDIAGEVPIPDDLLSDEEESPRYSLPNELVKVQYDMVPVATVPQTVGLSERIVISAPSSRHSNPYDLGAYEEAVQDLNTRFALRVAHAREARFRLLAAGERHQQLFTLKELERQNLNWRNQVNNTRLDEELSSLRKWWEETRKNYNDEIRRIEEDRITYRMERHSEIEAARKTYWEVQERCSKERDTRDQERRQFEKEQERDYQKHTDELTKQRDKQQFAEQQQAREREQLLQEEALKSREARRVVAQKVAEDTEASAEAAELAKQQVEAEVIARFQEQLTAASEKYQKIFEEAVTRVEVMEAELREAADKIEAELLSERSQREEWLHSIAKETAEEAARQNDTVHTARRAFHTTVNSQGKLPGLASLNKEGAGDIVTSQTDTAHLSFSNRHQGFKKYLHHVGDFVAHIALGSIFGLSLGLLTKFARLDGESIQKFGYSSVYVSCAFGIFIFFLIGRLAFKASTFATEEMDAARKSGEKNRGVIAVGLASLVLVGVVVLEASVERFGLGEIIRKQMELNMESGVPSKYQELSLWVIAFIVSAPFMIYHSYEGAMETRYRLGEKQHQSLLAVQRYELEKEEERLNEERLLKAQVAKGTLDAEETQLRLLGEGLHHPRREAERRIEEINALLTTHPDIVRWQEFVARRDSQLEGDPLLLAAKAQWDRVKQSLDSDPRLKSARLLAEEARFAANDAHRRAESAESELSFALEDAARQLITRTGSSVAEVLGQKSGELVSGALNLASQAARGGFGGATSPFGIAATIAEKALIPSNTAGTEVETWEETMARERWNSLRGSIANDPKIRFYAARVSSLQSMIRSLDTQYGKRRKQLMDQKRAIEVRLLEDEHSNRMSEAMRSALHEAELDVQAAQLNFNEEIDRLMKLHATPSFLRWITAYLQNRDSQSKRQMEASSRVKPLLVSSYVPRENKAMEIPPKVLPVEMPVQDNSKKTTVAGSSIPGHPSWGFSHGKTSEK